MKAGVITCAVVAQRAYEALRIWGDRLDETEKLAVRRELARRQDWIALRLWREACADDVEYP